LRQRIVRDRIEPVGEAIGAAEGPEHAGHRARFREIHTADARMGMRRTNHGEVTLAGGGKVIAETAGPGDEAEGFFAGKRRADVAEWRRVWLAHNVKSSLVRVWTGKR